MTNLMITSPTAAHQPAQHEGIDMLLLHEALARSRMREAEQAAREYALARALIQGRRWRMLARFAERRAAAAAERVPAHSRRVLRSA